jgi:hypothetical protein
VRSSRRRALYSLLGPIVVVALSGCGGAPASPEEALEGEGGDVPDLPARPAEASNRFFIALDDEPVPPVVLELDKQKALELFGEEAAREIRVLEMDPAKLLGNVLSAIRNACGQRWTEDRPDPRYDCADTALGRTFGADWRTSPEFAMVRLLGMTPANADLTGTGLEEFAKVVEQNPGTLEFTFGDVLAESLGIAKTSPFISTGSLVDALVRDFLGTHPVVREAGGKLPVSLHDALLDLAPLAQQLGPVGDHPGVLVPDDGSFQTRSDALGPAFRMRVVAESNLRRVQGIDLSAGGGDMFLSESNAPLSFDFEDPERLSISGMAEAPTMDMRLSIAERRGFVPACSGAAACKQNGPRSPVGEGTTWTTAPFELEHIVADAGLVSYAKRVFDACYLRLDNDCLMGVNIGGGNNPPGWMSFSNDLRSVSVPEPRFLWELLGEIAQIALHDPTGDGAPDIAEGGARPVFALRGVPIGFTGEELVAQMRPALQSQADEMADVILGRYWENNDDLDFYWRRASPGGKPYLHFVAPSDLRPDPGDREHRKPYTYDKPGFFASPDLSDASKVSRAVVEGSPDTTHEKYALPAGETVLYAQDDGGRVYELRFFVPEGDAREIAVEVNAL